MYFTKKHNEKGLNLSWIIFSSTVLALLVLDLGIFNKKDEAMSLTHSLLLSLFYILIAAAFGVYIAYAMGGSSAREYYTGFLLEKTMALDNIFIISVIFRFFNIPLKYQHRVLFWGIIGVIVLRAIMIYAGAALIAKFSWILFIFAVVLILTGFKTFYITDKHVNIQDMYVYKLLRKYFNISRDIKDNSFFISENGKLYITPLFVSLVTVEAMDVVFAVDSIPAIFAVTQNTFIVYTSNIFAILGLRALFFCLADIVERFKYIKYSLGVILILIGIKIFVAHYIKIPTVIPLAVTVVLLIIGIVASVVIDRRKEGRG
jgi:tellurite resistance protein TerC